VDISLALVSSIPASHASNRNPFSQHPGRGRWPLPIKSQHKGDFFTTISPAKPIVVTRAMTDTSRFYNVCRHHAAAVVTEPQKKAAQEFPLPVSRLDLRQRRLAKGMVDSTASAISTSAKNGLVPIAVTLGKFCLR